MTDAATLGAEMRRHFDHLVQDRPPHDGPDFPEAVRCLTAFRDAVLRRHGPAERTPEERERLARLNAVLSVVLGLQYPLGEPRWAWLEQARDQFNDIVQELAPIPNQPVRFDPAMETSTADEAETQRELSDAMRTIIETTWKDYGHAVRSVHAKSHGLLQGELRVLDELPPVLAQGVFARPGTFPVVLRLSTNPGDILDDSVSTPRGLAVKLVGVEGERLPGSEGATTQDFVMANAPAFQAKDAKAFLSSVQLLARTTDTPQAYKKVLSAVLRGAESVVEAVGGESATLKSLGGHPETHILGETFYTQAPILYGPYVAKLAVAPVSPNLTRLTGAALNVNGKPNGLRDAVSAFFAAEGGEWEVRVQLLTDPDSMPIEDASVPWPEDRSPYVPVARISVGPQPSWTEARAAAVDDGLSFSPWHGLAAHRPLGSVMRARRPVYEMSAGFRASHNGCPIHEPRELGPLPA